jgi:formate transporter
MAKATHSMSGKILIIWLPIATFFALGFEHAVVNLFVFPLAMLSGADITIYDWWVWNQIPVTLGNIIGAVLFNCVLWAKTHQSGQHKDTGVVGNVNLRGVTKVPH